MSLVKVAIALGSNLGNSPEIIAKALQFLKAKEGIKFLKSSSLYQTVPVGPPQPDYINACATLVVELPLLVLLDTLLAIEAQFGRVRLERWQARTLDLDIILYQDLILDTPRLTIPHPRMSDRAFVLVPLAEIAPDWLEPVTQKTISQLLQGLDCRGVRKIENIPHPSPLPNGEREQGNLWKPLLSPFAPCGRRGWGWGVLLMSRSDIATQR